jgi:hypothetical protein
VAIGYLELIVRDTDESGAVKAVGLSLHHEPQPGPASWPVIGSFIDLAAIARSRLTGWRRARMS